MLKRFFSNPFVQDTAERASKSAGQGFIVGSAIDMSGAAFSIADVDWANGLNFGLGMMLVSVLTSLLSYRRGGNGGTASLCKAVEYRELRESDSEVV